MCFGKPNQTNTIHFFSQTFQAYTASQYPGTAEQTPLMLAFRDQGIKIPSGKNRNV